MSIYLNHFGLTKAPFNITPSLDFFFSGANRGAILEALIYAALNVEGIVKVTGEVGSGKTMLCRMLIDRLPANVETVYLANPALTREEILYAVAEELNLDFLEGRAYSIARVLQSALIDKYAEGKRVVVVIDEAHAMPEATLEQLRLLYNLESGRHKLLQIVLFGQPELDQKLALPQMRQLRERITHHFAVGPMSRLVLGEYLDFRMRAAGFTGSGPFSSAAAGLIWRASGGLTRRANILADKALLAAYIDGSGSIRAKHARIAIADNDSGGSKVRPSLIASLISVLALLGVFLGTSSSEPLPSPPASGRIEPVDILQQKLAALSRVVSKQQGSGATIQLLEIDDANRARRLLLESAKLLDSRQLYLLQSKQKYWLFYGVYPSKDAAQIALDSLPEVVRAGRHPSIRPFSDFQIAKQQFDANVK